MGPPEARLLQAAVGFVPHCISLHLGVLGFYYC